jgi:hypothetical protein
MSKLVRLIFDLCGTGQYSDVSLARHLNVAGYRGKNGIEITDKAIRTILNNHELYLGYIKRHWRRPDRELRSETSLWGIFPKRKADGTMRPPRRG